jgi:predicted metalloprotease with PDZ domain
MAQRADRAPAPPPPPVSAPISNVRYAVTFDQTTARTRSLRVSMTFNVAGNDPVLLSLPAWTPGAYEISDYVRKVTGFTVTGEGGVPRWDKFDPDTWRVLPKGARSLTLAFSYAADSMTTRWRGRPRTSCSSTDERCRTRKDRPPTSVDGHDPHGRELARGDRNGARTQPRIWTARNYHDLVDMPFFIGPLDVDSARVGETMFRTVTYPRGVLSGADREKFWNELKKMVPPMVKVFGETPVTTYANLIVFDSSMAGAAALEHQNSHVGIYSPFIIDHEFFPSITAHEIFHLWT